MAELLLGAKSAHRNAARDCDILKLKINGVTPFLSHPDCVNDRLSEAHAFLMVLSAGFLDADDALSDPKQRETITGLRPRIIAQALEGVAALVAYAQHHTDRQSGGEQVA